MSNVVDQIELGLLKIGEKITCPICGMDGKISIRRFKSKGKKYTYYVVVHKVDGKTKYCILSRTNEKEYWNKYEVPRARVRYFTSTLSKSTFYRNERRYSLWHLVSNDFRVLKIVLKINGTPKVLAKSENKVFEVLGVGQGAKLDASIKSNQLKELKDCRYFMRRFNYIYNRVAKIYDLRLNILKELFQRGSFILASIMTDYRYVIDDIMRFILAFRSENEFFNYYITTIALDAKMFFVKVWPWRFNYNDLDHLYELVDKRIIVRVWRTFIPDKVLYRINFVIVTDRIYEIAKIVDDLLSRLRRETKTVANSQIEHG